MRAVIFPWKFGSAGAKALAKKLETVRVRDTGRYRKRPGDIVIGWGATSLPTWGVSDLNKQDAIKDSVNKKTALQKMKDAGVRTVEFTDDSDIVSKWLTDGDKVYARRMLRASEGRGIQIISKGDTIPRAELYTKGIVSDGEYRLHVFGGLVIDYTKKIQIAERGANVNSLIRSHTNGWTFARNVERRESLIQEATKAVSALGLDFGAVDIIVNPKDKNRPYVLEVNSAPGLHDGGRTLDNYATAIKTYIQNRG